MADADGFDREPGPIEATFKAFRTTYDTMDARSRGAGHDGTVTVEEIQAAGGFEVLGQRLDDTPESIRQAMLSMLSPAAKARVPARRRAWVSPKPLAPTRQNRTDSEAHANAHAGANVGANVGANADASTNANAGLSNGSSTTSTSPTRVRPYLPELRDFTPGVYVRGTEKLEREMAAKSAMGKSAAVSQQMWCSFHTTRRAAEILGESYETVLRDIGGGDPRPGFGAWHKRGRVLAHGGASVWTPKDDGPLAPRAYAKMQVGDFVSLENGRMPAAAKRYPDLQFESGARHSGVIVGKDARGVPVVEHNFHGTVYREPINDLSRSPMSPHYRALSVFRAKRFTHRGSQLEANYEQAVEASATRASWKNPLPFASTAGVEDEGEQDALRTWVDVYRDTRQAFGVAHQVTPDSADQTFRDVIAIGVQESNLDNAIVRPPMWWHKPGDMAKVMLTDDATGWVHQTAQSAALAFRNYHDSVSNEDAAENAKENAERGLLPNIPAWKKEIEAIKLTQTGRPYEDALGEVKARYGESEVPYVPPTAKSKGPFRIKWLPERVRRDLSVNPEAPQASLRSNLLSAMALYQENYARAQRTFPPAKLPPSLNWTPEQRDRFYRDIAILAHNAPSKAFNPEFVDFFVAPVVSGAANDPNPDRARYKADYIERVRSYARELWQP